MAGATEEVMAGATEEVMASTMIGKQAVVIGAGMGGLAAAGALAGHFEEVVVLERDALPTEAKHRAGTPQSRHVHGLQASGQRALDELFPDFARDLVQSGAVPHKLGLEILIERPGYDPFPARDLGFTNYSASRPTIEYTLRQRVESLANTTVRERCRVRELVTSPDGARISGVRYENADGASEMMPADLVVDASGRGALTLALLRSIGRPQPEETTIGIDIAYSTCVFEWPDHMPCDWKGVMHFGRAPEDKRGALMFQIEGDRWMVTLNGRHGVVPPGDADGFLAYARELRTPTIYNAIKDAKRATGVARHAFPDSVHRHFERLAFFPRGLLPIADAICQFNPVYGQGMSVAAQEACLLRRLLDKLMRERDPLAELAPAFFAEAQGLIETPWAAAMQDFAFPQTRGRRPPDFEATLKFGSALIRLAAEDPAVHRLMAEVINLLKPRSVYKDPKLVKRIMAVMASQSDVLMMWSR
jgi:2-polyprenyl-6-methoxyphenol hydroxylase-like FAD-dependent oxidoreductase